MKAKQLCGDVPSIKDRDSLSKLLQLGITKICLAMILFIFGQNDFPFHFGVKEFIPLRSNTCFKRLAFWVLVFMMLR